MKKKQLIIIARKKESVRRKLAITAENLAAAALEKEEARRKLEIVAKELRVKAVQLAKIAKKLAVVAKEKEEVRRRLAVVAEELRRKAKQLAKVAKEKEDARRKLLVIAEELRIKAKQLATVAREKEEVRRKLAVVARKLATTAKKLAITAKQLALVATEKENVRRRLAITAEQLRLEAEQQGKIEKRLKESETQYRRLFETAHDGIIILDSQTGQIIDVNPFLENLLGYSKNEFLNKKIWEVGAFKNIKASMRAFKFLQRVGASRYDNLPLETRDGRAIDVEFVSNSYMAGGKLVIQCNIRDISERKKLEQTKEIKRLFEEEKAKVDSIADATHELRTPIAIIKGNVDLALMKNSKDSKPTKSFFKAIDYEIRHLSSILSDLTLITSKGGDLRNRIMFDKVNMIDLVNGVIGRAKTLAHKKNISVVSGKIPNVSILGDKVYLEKMLTNLVKNSIIYGNDNGHTKIMGKLSLGIIKLSVIDDGIGISTEDLPHVFERFYRADKSHSSDGNSIGLGLAIVKWVAEAHGGEVSVQNTPKGGSIFSVSLPIKSQIKSLEV